MSVLITSLAEKVRISPKYSGPESEGFVKPGILFRDNLCLPHSHRLQDRRESSRTHRFSFYSGHPSIHLCLVRFRDNSPVSTSSPIRDRSPIPMTQYSPVSNPAEPIPAQASKTPVYQTEALFEFGVDPTVLKVNKLEKLFKRAQGVNSIPDIEDGYTDSAVTLPNRFKMQYIDRFDGSGDPMVHFRLFLNILRPMDLTRLQKLSLFGRTILGIATIWYAKLEGSIKQNWKEMAEAFIAQYSYNIQIDVTTRDFLATR
ncbi:hypothetical protein ACSBR1_026365 [Camellia fascicularis]